MAGLHWLRKSCGTYSVRRSYSGSSGCRLLLSRIFSGCRKASFRCGQLPSPAVVLLDSGVLGLNDEIFCKVVVERLRGVDGVVAVSDLIFFVSGVFATDLRLRFFPLFSSSLGVSSSERDRGSGSSDSWMDSSISSSDSGSVLSKQAIGEIIREFQHFFYKGALI